MSGEGRPNAWGKPPQMPVDLSTNAASTDMATPSPTPAPVTAHPPPPPIPNAWGKTQQPQVTKPQSIHSDSNIPAHKSQNHAHVYVEPGKNVEVSDPSSRMATKVNANVNAGTGAKSWAEIARDPNAAATTSVMTEISVEQTEGSVIESSTKKVSGSSNLSGSGPESNNGLNNNNQESQQQHSHHQRYGGHGTGRGGRWNHNRANHPNSRSSPLNRPAGRRGLTFADLQNQSQQLMMVQRLVAAANQMRVDPNFLYHAQMQQYAAFYGNYVPMNYTTPGSIPLDENSYPHLQLLRMYPHLVAINQTQVMANPPHARYLVYRIDNELEAHHGIKYNLINIEEQFAPILNRALGEVSGLGPVYIFFVFPQARRCIGVAEMISAAVKRPEEDTTGNGASKDAETSEPHNGSNETTANTGEKKGNVGGEKAAKAKKKDTVVQVRWICVKDIHLGVFKRARMLLPPVSMQVESLEKDVPSEEAAYSTADAEDGDHDEVAEQADKDKGNEKKGGVYEDPPDIYLLDNTAGPTALQIMLEQHATSTMLLDLKMFDEAEANNGVMPTYYRSGVSTHSFQHNRFPNTSYHHRGTYHSRGRGSYTRGRGGQTSVPGHRGDKTSNFEKGATLNTGYRGGRRGRGDLSNASSRGRGRGRGGRGGRFQQPQGNKPNDQPKPDRPRRLAAGDGTEVVIQKEYQFPIQQKKGKKPKGKKEDTGDANESQSADPNIEAETLTEE